MYAVEGPGEATPVSPGISVDCAVRDAVGADVLEEVGVYVGNTVGDAVGPGIDCWGIGIKRKRTNQTPLATLLVRITCPA